jgi:hypothetical protein
MGGLSHKVAIIGAGGPFLERKTEPHLRAAKESSSHPSTASDMATRPLSAAMDRHYDRAVEQLKKQPTV